MNFKKFGIVLFTVLFVGLVCIVPCFAIWDHGDDPDLFDYNLSFLDYDYSGNVNIDSVFEGSYPNIVLKSYETTYRNDLSPGSYIYFSIENYNDYDVYVRVNFASGFSLYVDDVDLEGDFVDSGYVARIEPDGSDYMYVGFRLYCDDEFFESTDELVLMNLYFSDSPIDHNDYNVFDSSSLIAIIGNIGTLIFSSPFLIVLFFVGVTCSLGFVAVRVIRKVMWCN